MEKTCKKCGETKDISSFYKNKILKNGYRTYCKACMAIDNSRRELENSEKYSKIQSESNKKFYKKRKEQIKEISIWYINQKLKQKGFKKEQITPQLIEVQSIIIKTKRLWKTSQI